MVRRFVAERIGSEHLIPLLVSGNTVTREMFDLLPYQFVIKANHGSAMNKIVQNKKDVDYKDLKKETDRWLSRNFYMGSRETQYRNIPPFVIAEKLMLDENGEIPKDYKIHCFNHRGSKHFVIQVDSDRFNGHVRDYYTSDWERIYLTVKYPNSQKAEPLEKPPALDNIIKLADMLAQGFSYVRVDLYAINGKVYFGEMTFTPGSGFERFVPHSMDEKWGEWFDLPRQLSLQKQADLDSPVS